ncbi:hypothetical protein QBC40DRAFT_41139 [Triangularia verruculosa]|uniref:Uncharacterized protein n=1 Tax=Triangularia verruculosa TaxID=2587418 RepID=A0AAN7AXJ2_9PEZI|nr:hypothetical protein QBC40DRAFT_41139 [Triangularia verruculosa]
MVRGALKLRDVGVGEELFGFWHFTRTRSAAGNGVHADTSKAVAHTTTQLKNQGRQAWTTPAGQDRLQRKGETKTIKSIVATWMLSELKDSSGVSGWWAHRLVPPDQEEGGAVLQWDRVGFYALPGDICCVHDAYRYMAMAHGGEQNSSLWVGTSRSHQGERKASPRAGPCNLYLSGPLGGVCAAVAGGQLKPLCCFPKRVPHMAARGMTDGSPA